jgi:hypothetical protein
MWPILMSSCILGHDPYPSFEQMTRASDLWKKNKDNMKSAAPDLYESLKALRTAFGVVYSCKEEEALEKMKAFYLTM